MFLVVLGLCVASCLADPSIGYSYSAYAPLSHGYSPYLAKSIYPYGYPHYYNQPYSVISPVGVKTQYHTSDVYGQASYGHSEALQSHQAVQDAHGNKVGSFSYVKPDGEVHQTNYVADANGYRVVSNDVPVASAAVAIPSVAHIGGVPAVPAETPEVVAAKHAHFAAHAKALGTFHPIYKRSIYSYPEAPLVTRDGYISDTPEVSAAKAAHFAEHAKRGNYYVASAYAPVNAAYAPVNAAYYSAYHNPVVTADGYLADTPEVAAAKAAHFAEKAKVSASHHYAGASLHVPAYAPSLSYPVVGADGHVLDTPEVAAAKSAHLAEHAAAAAKSAAHHPPAVAYLPNAYPSGPLYTASHYSPAPSSYYASPVVLPDGHLADTPDVAHAKAAHYAEYAKVASRHKRSILELLTPAHTWPLVSAAALPLHSAYAHPVYPFLKPATHTTVVHGPHAVSYVQQS